MTERIRLTETSIRRLQPKQQEYTIWDTRLAGFGVRVRTTGRKSFVFHWSEAGKAQRITVGSAEFLSLDKALALLLACGAGHS